jgi:hypothetical protein
MFFLLSNPSVRNSNLVRFKFNQKSLSKTVDIEIAGYYQAQVNRVKGPDASNAKDSATAIGPEITFVCPKLGLSTSIRYLRETSASNRPQGNVLNLIFTKRLGK